MITFLWHQQKNLCVNLVAVWGLFQWFLRCLARRCEVAWLCVRVWSRSASPAGMAWQQAGARAARRSASALLWLAMASCQPRLVLQFVWVSVWPPIGRQDMEYIMIYGKGILFLAYIWWWIPCSAMSCRPLNVVLSQVSLTKKKYWKKLENLKIQMIVLCSCDHCICSVCVNIAWWGVRECVNGN